MGDRVGGLLLSVEWGSHPTYIGPWEWCCGGLCAAENDTPSPQARLKLARYFISAPIPPSPSATKKPGGEDESTHGVFEGKRGHYIAHGMELVTAVACCPNVDPAFKVRCGWVSCACSGEWRAHVALVPLFRAGGGAGRVDPAVRQGSVLPESGAVHAPGTPARPLLPAACVGFGRLAAETAVSVTVMSLCRHCRVVVQLCELMVALGFHRTARIITAHAAHAYGTLPSCSLKDLMPGRGFDVPTDVEPLAEWNGFPSSFSVKVRKQEAMLQCA